MGTSSSSISSRHRDLLIEAAQNADISVLRQYSDDLPKVKSFNGEGILHDAVMARTISDSSISLNKALECIRFITNTHPQLLRLKADDGRIPLHFACTHCELAIIQFLAEKDPATLRMATNSGETPLHIVCRAFGRRPSVVSFLIGLDSVPMYTICRMEVVERQSNASRHCGYKWRFGDSNSIFGKRSVICDQRARRECGKDVSWSSSMYACA